MSVGGFVDIAEEEEQCKDLDIMAAMHRVNKRQQIIGSIAKQRKEATFKFELFLSQLHLRSIFTSLTWHLST